MHILLVGDDVLTPAGLHQYLEEAMLKAEIVYCPDGSTAAVTAAQISRGIVIAHMNLPGSSYGSRVLRQAKEANKNIYTVLIIRTSLYNTLDAELKADIDCVFTLPLPKGKFRHYLRKTFRAIEDLEDHCRRREVYGQINQFLVSSSEKNQAVSSSFQRSGRFIKDNSLTREGQEPEAVKK